MDDHQRRIHQYRLRRESGALPEADAPALSVEEQIRLAIARGEFDNLPGAGKPIPDLGTTHDPDWWIKRLIEREQISGSALLPPALALRNEDANLESTIDAETTEEDVRRLLADFNARIVDARRQLLGGPPVITPLRDVDAEIDAWRSRRAASRQPPTTSPTPPRRRWWRRRQEVRPVDRGD